MKVLVACEFSGTVRDAFAALGHDAWSCDFLPCERDSEKHLVGNVLNFLYEKQWTGREWALPRWDLMIAHPPCTFLAASGLHWNKRRPERAAYTQQAIEFVLMLMDAPIERIAIENPIGCISSRIRKPDQVIQPWQFGHGEIKATCLWLKNLPPLVPTKIVSGRTARVHRMPPSPDRWKERSRTLQGIANAMAAQWSNLLL